MGIEDTEPTTYLSKLAYLLNLNLFGLLFRKDSRERGVTPVGSRMFAMTRLDRSELPKQMTRAAT